MNESKIIELFGYPEWAIPAAQQSELMKTAVVLAVAALIYAIWFSYRERSFYPVFLFIGAGAGIIYEPLGDVLTKVAYAPLEQVSLFTSFGRPIPLWMVPNYFFFFSVPVILLLQFVVREGTSPKKWWLTYFGIVAFVTLFEQPGIANQSWRYYGTHGSIDINTYPVWVGFVNAQSLYAMAAGIYFLRRHVIREKLSFLFVFMVPFLFVGSHVAAAMPISSATFTTQDPVIVNAAALITIFMACLSVWVGYKLVNLRPQNQFSP